MNCPNCHSPDLEKLGEQRFKCRDCGAKFHIAYYCRNCGAEISKERYEDHDELCEFCEDNEEMDEDEDFGIAPHY
jgi:ribosomal protein L37AE/L43A